jgi:hypothetical protein
VLGKGTTVHIYIPAIDIDRQEETVTDQQSILGSGNTAVLVIEDEKRCQKGARHVIPLL